MTAALHVLLQRQLRRLGIEVRQGASVDELRALLEAVSRAYAQADVDRDMLQRSLAVSGDELRELYEEKRRQTEARLGALVANVPGAVYRCRAEATRPVLQVSEGIGDLVGVGHRELVERQDPSLSAVVHGDDRGWVERAVGAAIEQRSGYSLEYRVVTAKGGVRWVSDRGSFVGEPGGPGYVDGILSDDTARRLSLDELRSARASAEQATAAKSAFLASMSHELRTPLNAVIGLSGLLLEQPLTEQAREMTEMLRRSGESLLDLIDNILDFSKIEANHLELELIDCDIEALVEHVLLVVAARAAAKGLEIGAIVDVDVPRVVRGDPARIRQVLLNFAANAIKFTSRGLVRIGVRLLGRGDDEALLRFEVRDTGPGIPDSAASRLFLPFSQADVSAHRHFGGTGLGLAISRRLARLMGGDVGHASVVGEGSTFWLAVPLPVVSRAGPTPPFAGRRIVVLDSSLDGAALLADLVTSFGATPVIATSAPQALSLVEQQRPFAALVAASTDDSAAALTALHRAGVRLVELIELGDACPERPYPVLSKPITSTRLRSALQDQLPSSRPAPAPKPLGRGGVSVLIVDDNSVNQRVLAMQLARLGVGSDLAADGVAALEALARRPYPLVLMDCQMPRMDGFEATRQIRQIEQVSGRRTVIVALTANALASEQQRCFDAGMDDFITKPVSLETLSERLERWLLVSAATAS